MLLVVDNEVEPDHRFLPAELVRLLPGEVDYRVFVDEPDLPEPRRYDGIVLSGSTAGVYEDEHREWIEREAELVRTAIDQSVPLLGICFGHQLVHRSLGGTVKPTDLNMTLVRMEHDGSGVLAGVNPIVPALHGDIVTEPGDDLVTTAHTAYNEYFCSSHATAPLWTVQFHPEFTERMRDVPDEWNVGSFDFDQCNASVVLENFASYCEHRETVPRTATNRQDSLTTRRRP